MRLGGHWSACRKFLSLIEMDFSGDSTTEEIAQATGISMSTGKRGWNVAQGVAYQTDENGEPWRRRSSGQESAE